MSGSNLSPTIGPITPYGMGLVHSRLAEALGVTRKEVCVVQWGGRPDALELWTSDGWGPVNHLGTFTPDFTAADPYRLPPREQWLP